jgi:hypothetical protein
LYQELLAALSARNREQFERNARFLLFDFNGEYTSESCMTRNKAVYSLSTHADDGDELPIDPEGLLDAEEVLSILADATGKTQKPFLVRSLRLLGRIRAADDPGAYFRGILRQRAKTVLQMSEKVRAQYSCVRVARDTARINATSEAAERARAIPRASVVTSGHVLFGVPGQHFVDEGLIAHTPALRFLPERSKHSRVQTNGNELAGRDADGRPADALHRFQLLRRRIGDVREINAARGTPRSRRLARRALIRRIVSARPLLLKRIDHHEHVTLDR